MTSITAAPSSAPALRRGRLAQLGIDTAYVLAGLPLAVVAFTLAVTGLSLGIGLIALFLVGIPVLVGTLFVSRGFAEAERARLAPVLRRSRVGVRYRRANPEATTLRRMLAPMGEVQYWLDTAHAVVRFPISVTTFCIVVTWWATALAGLTYGLWDWALPEGDPVGPFVINNRGLAEVLGFENTATNRIAVYFVVGLLFAVTLPLVVRICALTEAWVAHAMLNGVAGLRDQVAELSRDRDTAQAQTAAAVSAEATALRRLERDIHDGPQQRLVRLAMDLGRARQQLDADPAAAAHTVDEALVQTREALDELRTLSRGIAPPILTDRGLAAAVAALAARATVPVTLDIEDIRLPALVEQTAYFTIAEALANIAKHSGASQATVVARPVDGSLAVTITDDGRGGAHVAKGHGLAGLHDRLQAAGGSLWISSPYGGPTTIRAELPVGPESS
jgi:signal transduction histidine kinase